ncbi:MAG: hypothetical protein C4524_13745 [Candidatus Zixiibacteriota bacterium]|nr:MAG: hypothetical protein C4524_13745 [candidate division Zixibacteria bacterium]
MLGAGCWLLRAQPAVCVCPLTDGLQLIEQISRMLFDPCGVAIRGSGHLLPGLMVINNLLD